MFDQSKYDSLIAEIFLRHQSVQSAGFNAGSYKPGLETMLRFDAAQGHPSRAFRSIHVAGTNGKGSVSSMLASSLAASGYKVGLYTSPHLLDFRERIKIVEGDSFSLIPKEYVYTFVTGAELGDMSFFELTTALAFKYFAEEQVDIAVIETGLGGRLDSTNIITPELSVITSIGLDHCAILGPDRRAIATEKAGIFKPGVPALVWGHDVETDEVFENKAREIHCPLFFADDIAPAHSEMPLDLVADCQSVNLRTVLSALDLLGERVDEDAICHTASRTGLRGRWEILRNKPLTIADIGHNPQALAINFARLEQMPGPLVIVFGIMADKDLDSVARLLPERAKYILTAPKGPRALTPERLQSRLKELRPELDTAVENSVATAVEKALALISPDGTVYIGGSAFVVAETLPIF